MLTCLTVGFEPVMTDVLELLYVSHTDDIRTPVPCIPSNTTLTVRNLRVTGIWPSIVYTIVYYIDCVKLARSISPVSGPLYSIPLYTTLTVWYLRVSSALYLALYTLYHYTLH